MRVALVLVHRVEPLLGHLVEPQILLLVQFKFAVFDFDGDEGVRVVQSHLVGADVDESVGGPRHYVRYYVQQNLLENS